ncbi:hypothetical protein [uncultured Roseobacter sp.]|uniref:hypothetical protein n=1 Tax=uncultured Roseobacter sp. TaxID=114847 RepID=UPI00260F1007|nr:hypothetical protein [uncultured Roseobacter sp.]
MTEKVPTKKSKLSAAQIGLILKQAKNGVPVADLCRQYGMTPHLALRENVRRPFGNPTG